MNSKNIYANLIISICTGGFCCFFRLALEVRRKKVRGFMVGGGGCLEWLSAN